MAFDCVILLYFFFLVFLESSSKNFFFKSSIEHSEDSVLSFKINSIRKHVTSY